MKKSSLAHRLNTPYIVDMNAAYTFLPLRLKYLRSTLSLALFVTASIPCRGGGGESVFEFLRIPMNARAAALGNTFLTVRDDPAAIFSNPALIGTIKKPAASLGFVKYLMDMNAGYACYGQSLKSIGWVGGGVVYMNYGDFTETDRLGNIIGTFGVQDIAVTAAYGNRWEALHYGAAIKFIHSSIAECSSTGLAFDAGIVYEIPSENILLAASVSNVGAQLSPFGDSRESLPFEFRVGASTKLEHLPLTLELDFHKLNESRENFLDHFSAFSIGGEFVLTPNLRARVGYNNEMRRELKIGERAKLAGFSTGFGISVSTYAVDYAFTSFGEIGSLHRVSVGIVF
ncbi:MAG: type IX secretion system protein PorQ [Bacteroidota bacterium]|nr:type IX secretion system protein PorQ [Bacteroidota bacterium]